MKHILYLCHRIPYPPNKGDKIRSFNILSYLTQKNIVSVGCLIDTPNDLQYIKNIKKQTKATFYDQFSPKPKKIISMVKALLGRQSVSVPYFYSKKLQSQIDCFLADNPVDTIICSSSPSGEYILKSKHYHTLSSKVHLIMDFIDMDSQKWQQYGEREKFPVSWIYKREAHYLLKYEKRIAEEFNQLLIVSDAENALFQRQIPTSKMNVISNGVDLDFFHPDYNGSKTGLNSPALVFTGAMDYWPNVDGAKWFVQRVLPQIQKTFPETCLYLVGSNPTSELQGLAQFKGVTVTGFVDDVRDYIVQADVCIIPLHIARGIQNKVLEAMSMGKPVVSTPEAAEGLALDIEKDIYIHKDEISFAKAVIFLLQNKEAASILGRNARNSMENHYSWEKNLCLLDSVIEAPLLSTNT